MKTTIEGEHSLTVRYQPDSVLELLDISVHRVKSVKQRRREYGGSKWTDLTISFGDDGKAIRIVLFPDDVDAPVECQPIDGEGADT